MNAQEVFYKIVCINQKGERVSAVLRQASRGKWRVIYTPGQRTLPGVPDTKLFAWANRDWALRMAHVWSGGKYERWTHELWECTIENPGTVSENAQDIPPPYDLGTMRSFWMRRKDSVYWYQYQGNNTEDIILGDSITLDKLIWSSDQ